MPGARKSIPDTTRTAISSLQRAVATGTLNNPLVRDSAQQVQTDANTLDNDLRLVLVQVAALLEQTADQMDSGLSCDWGLNRRVLIAKQLSNKRKRVVSLGACSTLGWGYQHDIAYPPRPPLVEDFQQHIARADQLRKVLMQLEGWREHKALTLQNAHPLTHQDLYDLQGQVQQAMAQATKPGSQETERENAMKLKEELEKQATFRTSGVGYAPCLMHDVIRICNELCGPMVPKDPNDLEPQSGNVTRVGTHMQASITESGESQTFETFDKWIASLKK